MNLPLRPFINFGIYLFIYFYFNADFSYVCQPQGLSALPLSCLWGNCGQTMAQVYSRLQKHQPGFLHEDLTFSWRNVPEQEFFLKSSTVYFDAAEDYNLNVMTLLVTQPELASLSIMLAQYANHYTTSTCLWVVSVSCICIKYYVFVSYASWQTAIYKHFF